MCYACKYCCHIINLFVLYKHIAHHRYTRETYFNLFKIVLEISIFTYFDVFFLYVSYLFYFIFEALFILNKLNLMINRWWQRGERQRGASETEIDKGWEDTNREKFIAICLFWFCFVSAFINNNYLFTISNILVHTATQLFNHI